MDPVVIELLREDFNAMSNAGLIDSAYDRNMAILSYFNQDFINRPVLFRIETPYGRIRECYFKYVDFTKPKLIYAIEDYVLGGAKTILNLAPERGIDTALRQIFGRCGLELIERGEMVVSGEKVRHVPREHHEVPERKDAPFGRILPFPVRGFRDGSSQTGSHIFMRR